MKVFLTGGTGFVGSHLARILVKEGCEVYALIRPESNLQRIHDILSSLHIVKGSLHEKETLQKNLRAIKPEMAFHLAWQTVPGQYWKSLENIPLLGESLELAVLLADAGCKKLIATGSCFEYDTMQEGSLSETSPTKPRSIYAASKLALYLILEQLASISGMQIAWPRFFYLYGPFENPKRLVPSIILSILQEKAVKAGPQKRDFLHAEDAANAVWAVARSSLTGAVNVGSGRPVSISSLAATIGAILDRPDLVESNAGPPDPSDPMLICADNSVLLNNTLWKQKHNLEEGLCQVVNWWKINRQDFSTSDTLTPP